MVSKWHLIASKYPNFAVPWNWQFLAKPFFSKLSCAIYLTLSRNTTGFYFDIKTKAMPKAFHICLGVRLLLCPIPYYSVLVGKAPVHFMHATFSLLFMTKSCIYPRLSDCWMWAAQALGQPLFVGVSQCIFRSSGDDYCKAPRINFHGH